MAQQKPKIYTLTQSHLEWLIQASQKRIRTLDQYRYSTKDEMQKALLSQETTEVRNLLSQFVELRAFVTQTGKIELELKSQKKVSKEQLDIELIPPRRPGGRALRVLRTLPEPKKPRNTRLAKD